MKLKYLCILLVSFITAAPGFELVEEEYGTCVNECSADVIKFQGKTGKLGQRGEKGEPGLDCRCCERLRKIKVKYNNLLTERNRPSCTPIKMGFPRVLQTTDYIRLMATFPDISDITMCAKVHFNSTGDICGTLLSYATMEEVNEMLILNRAVVFGKTKFKLPENLGSPNSNQHFCLVSSFSDNTRHVKAYIAGINQFSASNSRKAQRLIKGGGYFLFGQDQDEFMGGFEARQSYYGDIDNFSIWDRALSDDEIANVYHKCGCKTEASIIPTENNIELVGAATLKFSDCT